MAFGDGRTSIAMWQARNFDVATGEFRGPDVIEAATLDHARRQFAQLVDDLDAPEAWADVFSGPAIEADQEPQLRLTVGPRGGIRTERH